MQSTTLALLALSATAFAHPQRHHRIHASWRGTGGAAMPTGESYPSTNGTDFGAGSSNDTVLPTLTVSPLPAVATSGVAAASSFSSPVAAFQSSVATTVDAASESPSCSNSTIYTTVSSVQLYTVTTTAAESDVSPSVALSSIADSVNATSAAPVSELSSATASLAARYYGGRSKSRTSSSQASSAASSAALSAPASVSSVVSSVGSAQSTTFLTQTSAAASSAAWGSSSTSSAAPASTSASSSSSVSSGKKGLAYNVAALTDPFAGKGISWVYNWGNAPFGTVIPGVEFVPMMWGLKSDFASTWSSAAKAAIASGSKHLLSFNEPDLDTQANMSPATAAASHITHMNPFAGTAKIGSPAVTNGGGSMGIGWLTSFFQACNGQCKVDFIAFHWYDSAQNIAYFKSHVQDVITFAASQGITKVWLTEFGASGSDAEVEAFLAEATSFLDSTSAVEGYAYFMAAQGILLDSATKLSAVGDAYVA